MRTVIHVSDLHFGSILLPTLEPLLEIMWSLKPDLVIVSGDLTQRAKVEQFREAAAFIARMPSPRIVVPGNHDIPLYDVLRRFTAPLERYKEFITTDLSPVYFDDELAAIGINSARSLTSGECRDISARLLRHHTSGRNCDIDTGARRAEFILCISD